MVKDKTQIASIPATLVKLSYDNYFIVFIVK